MSDARPLIRASTPAQRRVGSRSGSAPPATGPRPGSRREPGRRHPALDWSEAETATLVLVRRRRPSRSRAGAVAGAGRRGRRDAIRGTMSSGDATAFARPRQHAVPSLQPPRIGAAADLHHVPASAADRARAVPRRNRSAAETAALLVRGRRPNRSRSGNGLGRRVGSARMPGRDALRDE